MAIITISRGSFTRGKEVAEKAAQRLGYGCISREVLLQAPDGFNIPEIKLIHAIEDAPSILDRFTHGREKYIAYIQSALFDQIKKDNMVYHGFACHFFVQDISNVLKVRINSSVEDRIKIGMERDRLSRSERLDSRKEADTERSASFLLFSPI
ncbi:MAG: cytidylate kinase-like family protein [Deltaproteobacteria bacterium]|nr:cytidylate kinase-like family protein [Deltaproteobacteria bacterium]